MNKYIYIDTATMEEILIEADDIQVTTNGELVFLNLKRSTGENSIVAAGVAPGFWVRFWTVGELTETPLQDEND